MIRCSECGKIGWRETARRVWHWFFPPRPPKVISFEELSKRQQEVFVEMQRNMEKNLFSKNSR